MKSCLVILIVLISSLSLNAQTYIKPRVIGNANVGSCNNQVVLETNNLPSHSYVTFDNVNPTPSSLVNTGDTVNNMCITHPFVMNSTNQHFHMATSNGYFVNAGVLYSSGVLPHFNYSVSNYVEPSGGWYDPRSYDGQLTLEFDSAFVLGSGYTVYAFQEEGDVNAITYPTSTSITFDNLSIGWMTVLIPSLIDSADHLETRFYMGDPNDMYKNTGLTMSLSWQHADNNCDGWVQAVPTNATGNTYTIWDNGISNQTGQANLCPGMYSVYTYEVDAQANFYAGSIDTFVLTNNSTAFIDSSIYLYAAQDTSYYNFQDCAYFDFSAAIDTLTYTEDTVYQGGGLTIVVFEMTLYQDSMTVIVSDSLVMLNDSLIHLDVVLYCDSSNPSNKASTFNGRRIAFLRGVDSHSFSQGVASVPELNIPSVSIYPNPVEGILNISLENSSVAEIRIYDSSGRKVHDFEMQESESQVDLSSIGAGVYYVQIVGENLSETLKFVKR